MRIFVFRSEILPCIIWSCAIILWGFICVTWSDIKASFFDVTCLLFSISFICPVLRLCLNVLLCWSIIDLKGALVWVTHSVLCWPLFSADLFFLEAGLWGEVFDCGSLVLMPDMLEIWLVFYCLYDHVLGSLLQNFLIQYHNFLRDVIQCEVRLKSSSGMELVDVRLSSSVFDVERSIKLTEDIGFSAFGSSLMMTGGTLCVQLLLLWSVVLYVVHHWSLVGKSAFSELINRDSVRIKLSISSSGISGST